MVPEPTRALYVRVPAALAEKLDRTAERLGTSKREVITRLVGDQLGLEEDLRPQRFWVTPEAEVLTLEEAADLLRVEPADVAEMVESGELPARRIGSQWRLSRAAVMEWLRVQT